MTGTQRSLTVIGGGTGSFHVLSGLRHHPELEIRSIVTMMDSGGDSGRLRDEFGVLPPGDMRRCLVALSEESELLRELFSFRFEEEPLSGRSFGNLFLLALNRMLGSEKAATEAIGRLLKIRGQVIPVTWDHAHLVARLADGTTVEGEANIDVPKHDAKIPIQEIRLEPKAHANPDALAAVASCDAIVLAPGDLYTSTVPNLLVEGMPEAIRESKAPLIYILNLLSRYGGTLGYGAARHVEEIARYSGRIPDAVLAHHGAIAHDRMRRYEEEDAHPVPVEARTLRELGVRLLHEADLLSTRDLVRHDPIRTAAALLRVIDTLGAG